MASERKIAQQKSKLARLCFYVKVKKKKNSVSVKLSEISAIL